MFPPVYLHRILWQLLNAIYPAIIRYLEQLFSEVRVNTGKSIEEDPDRN